MKELFSENLQAGILFEMSIDMMCIISFEGKFLHLNPAWVKLGYSLDYLKSKNNLGLVHTEDIEKTIRESKRITETKGETISFENRYLCKNGDYIWLSWNAKVSNDFNYIYAVARDITESKNKIIKKN